MSRTNKVQKHDPAPPFTLKDQYGKKRTLEEFRGQNVALFFYPRDEGRHSTAEAVGFRELLDDLAANNTTVIGVSPDGKWAHRRFAKRNNLNFLLLTDRDHKVASKYGVWDDDKDETRMATLVIDHDGRIDKLIEDIDPSHHADRVLKHVQTVEREESWESMASMPDAILKPK